jgi:hypothetical protein
MLEPLNITFGTKKYVAKDIIYTCFIASRDRVCVCVCVCVCV